MCYVCFNQQNIIIYTSELKKHWWLPSSRPLFKGKHVLYFESTLTRKRLPIAYHTKIYIGLIKPRQLLWLNLVNGYG
jgi:hypothetical protein